MSKILGKNGNRRTSETFSKTSPNFRLFFLAIPAAVYGIICIGFVAVAANMGGVVRVCIVQYLSDTLKFKSHKCIINVDQP